MSAVHQLITTTSAHKFDMMPSLKSNMFFVYNKRDANQYQTWSQHLKSNLERMLLNQQ